MNSIQPVARDVSGDRQNGPLAKESYVELVRRALAEDLGAGDVTSLATVDAGQRARGVLLAKCACVVAGLDVAFETFRQLDPTVETRVSRPDGTQCSPGDEIAEILGSSRALLAGERTALNFLQRLTGTASLAARFVDAAGGRITILDTRKTTPTFRALEKYAVRVGGATNHRMRLDDGMLIKDNHLRLAGGVAEGVRRARAWVDQRSPDVWTSGGPDVGESRSPEVRRSGRQDVGEADGPAGRGRSRLLIEVEVETLDQVDEALTAGADMLLLDNMSTADIREAVARSRGRARTEISGGVTLTRLPELAATGADYVSVGALTHSAASADISFELYPA